MPQILIFELIAHQLARFRLDVPAAHQRFANQNRVHAGFGDRSTSARVWIPLSATIVYLPHIPRRSFAASFSVVARLTENRADRDCSPR
jgi:hypothetical protein